MIGNVKRLPAANHALVATASGSVLCALVAGRCICVQSCVYLQTLE